MDARIAGIEYHLPERVETLEELAREHPDWPVEKLAAESGVRARRRAAPGETASDLGAAAARKLLDRNLVPRDQVDFLLYCTQCPDHFLPAGACLLQEKLGLSRAAGALDLGMGCSGFVYGLFLADALIRSGARRNVLLIASDTIAKLVHPQDRALRVLFGDAAGAALITAGGGGPGRLGRFVLGTNGAGASKLIVPAGGFRLPRSAETARETADASGSVRTAENLYMDGAAIFTFAITVIPRAVQQLLDGAGLKPEMVDHFVFHQASLFLLKQVATRCRVPPGRLVLALEDVGNTSSASIPIALARAEQAGSLRAGQRVVLAGFGVGFSWALCEMVWG